MRVTMSEEMNNYLNALSKEHSNFIQKWVDTLNTPELDEYISHLTEKEKDALFILLIIKSMNIDTITNAEKTEEYIINQEENCNIVCDIIRDITGIDIRKEKNRRRSGMTNAEKYKEVFGMEVGPSMCPTKNCPNCPCENCKTASTFWEKEYKKDDAGGGAE